MLFISVVVAAGYKQCFIFNLVDVRLLVIKTFFYNKMALQYWTVFNCTHLSSFHVICKNMQMAAPVADVSYLRLVFHAYNLKEVKKGN